MTAAFKFIVQYAAAAYCPQATDKAEGSQLCISKTPSVCSNFVNTVTVKEFGDSDGVGGNIAVNNDKSIIIVSFRGTKTVKDILTDLNAFKTRPLATPDSFFPIPMIFGTAPG